MSRLRAVVATVVFSSLILAVPLGPGAHAEADPVAPPGAKPVERPLPASARPNHGLSAGRDVPTVPPAVKAGGAPGKATPEADARRIRANAAARNHVTADPTPRLPASDLLLRPGFLLGDTSLVVYFNADVDDNDPTSFAEWFATVRDVETGVEQRSVTLGKSDLARCGVPREFCRSFGRADGWILVEGRQYTVRITVIRPDGVEEVSAESNPSVPRRTVETPAIPAAQAAGCACPNALGRTIAGQALRGALVNTATGAFVRTERDLGMPAFGIPFEAIRTYSSSNPNVGMFGAGWSWTYDAQVVAADDGAVRVRAEDGAEAVYRQAADGSFTRPPGVRAKLSRDGAGWRLVPPDQRVLTFDAQGRLVSVKDARGHGVTLTYDPNGLLASVTDAAGRVVLVTQQADVRQIRRITLPDGRYVEYGYANGRLATVKDARGFTWKYGYDAAGRLEKVTDPRGVVQIRNVYDADSRVVEQFQAKLDKVEPLTRFFYDIPKQQTSTTDPDGVITIDGYNGNVLIFSRNGNGDVVNHRHDEGLRRTLVVDPKGNQEEVTHDTEGNPVASKAPDPFGYTERNTFDGGNNVRTHTDGRGNTWNYDYNGNNEMTGQRNPEQQEGYKYEHDARGLLARRTDPRGKVTTYEYDANGARTAEIAPTGRRTEFTYDLTSRMVSIVDPRGTVAGGDKDRFRTRLAHDQQDRVTEHLEPGKRDPSRTRYDEVGNVLSRSDPLGNTARFEYDKASRLVVAKDPAGNVTRYTYTLAGRRLSSTDGVGNTTSRTFDTQGRVKTETSPRGNADKGARKAEFTTTFFYDANGNLVRAERPYPGGGVAQVDAEFDELNRPVGQVDEMGKRTSVGYDNAHHVTDMKNERNESLSYGYDKAGRRTGATDAEGRSAAEIQYDESGNPTRQVTPTGGVITWQYDDDGRVIALTEPRGNVPGADPNQFTTRYTYDPAGNPETVTDPLGGTSRLTYDPTGRLTTRTDANGHTVRYRYDDADRLAEVFGADTEDRVAVATGEPAGATTTSPKSTRYTYNANGMVTKRTDPLDHSSVVSYDRANRPVTTVDPLGRKREMAYDADSNLIELVTAAEPGRSSDRARRTIFQSFDNLDRVVGKRHGTDGPRFSYGYDGKSRLTALADAGGVRTHTYDDTDRLTEVNRGGQKFSYEYDPNDNVTARVYPDGTRIAATYDVGDRLTSLTAGRGGTSARFEFGYDVADNLIRTTYPAPTGVVEERAYDPAGRLNQVASKRGDTVLASYDLALDPVGNPSKITTTRGGIPGQPTATEATAYTYDPVNRITAACFGAQTCAGPAAERIDYTYDLVGNRTSQKKTAAGHRTTARYTYDAADQLVKETTSGSRSNERTFAYDPEGNQTRAGSDTFSYHLDHTLASAKVDGKTTTYTYDAGGLRLSATTGSGPDQVSRAWAWDVNRALPTLAMETETSRAGMATRGYLHTGAGPLALLQPSGTGLAAHPYLHDWLGGVAGVVAPNGTPEWAYDYDPFGNARGDGLVDGGRKLSDDAPTNRLQFAGGYSDPTQGERYHLGAREYEPATGRFGGIDAMPASATTPTESPYGYASNRPTVLTDPSGLRPIDGEGEPVDPPADEPATPPQELAGGNDPNAEVDINAEQREAARKSVEEAENAVKQIGDEIVNLILDLVGFNDAKKCVTEGDIVACISTALQAVPWGKMFKAAKVMIKAIGVGKRLIEGYSRLKSARAALEAIPKVMRKVADGANKAVDATAAAARKTADAAADLAKKSAAAGKKAAGDVRNTARKVKAKLKKSQGCNSFAPGTLVKMADGSAKPIEQVKPGDTVLASDPDRELTAPHQVTAALTGAGDKHLVDLTLVGAGAGGGGPPDPGAAAGGRITATDEHPFWTSNRGWVDAADLKPGDLLRDDRGRSVTVAAVAHRKGPATVHNLTVDDKSTYFVQTADGTTALTHNTRLRPQAGNAAGSCPVGGSGTRGRRGSQSTRDHLDQVRDDILDANPGMRHVAGGRNRATGAKLEERAVNEPGGTGRRFPDLTFETPTGQRLYVQTVDTYASGAPTIGELEAALDIARWTGRPVVLYPKP